jgi:hypothetical protein
MEGSLVEVTEGDRELQDPQIATESEDVELQRKEKAKESGDHDRTTTEDLSKVKVYRCFQKTLQQISFSFSPKADRVNDHCCYLFYLPSLEQLLVWIGKMSSIEDSQLTEKILLDLSQELKCSHPPRVFKRLDLDDIPSPDSHLSLGSLLTLSVSHEEEPLKNEPIQVYQFDSTTSAQDMRRIATFHPNSVSYSTRLPMSLLDDQLALVIESALSVFLWIGQHCPLDPSKLFDFSSSSFSSLGKSVSLIRQGAEPLVLTLLFHNWNPEKIIESYSTSLTSSPSPSSSSPSSASRRKSLVAERRQSFTKHNSVPNLSAILPQRQGSFYQKVQSQSEGTTKWSLASRSSDCVSVDQSVSLSTDEQEDGSLVQREADRIEERLSEGAAPNPLETSPRPMESQPPPSLANDKLEGTEPEEQSHLSDSQSPPLADLETNGNREDLPLGPSPEESELLTPQAEEQVQSQPQEQTQGGQLCISTEDVENCQQLAPPAPLVAPQTQTAEEDLTPVQTERVEEDSASPQTEAAEEDSPQPAPPQAETVEDSQQQTEDQSLVVEQQPPQEDPAAVCPLQPSAEIDQVAQGEARPPQEMHSTTSPTQAQDDRLPPSPSPTATGLEQAKPSQSTVKKRAEPEALQSGEDPRQRSTIPIHQKNQCHCM